MHKRTVAQTILVLVMFGLSLAIFLLFTMRGRFWWGISGAIGSYLLLFWLTAPYLSQLDAPDRKDKPFPKTNLHPPRPRHTPHELWLAEVVNPHGEAVYGRAGQYVDALYYGRVAHGAVVQLLDLKPIQNDFGLLIVPAQVLFDPLSEVTNFGTAVWLKLNTLSIAPYFRSQINAFDLDALRQETVRLSAHYEAYQPPPQISQPPSFPKGLVTAGFGTAVYGHEPAYNSDAYLTRLSHGTKLLLLTDTVTQNNHNILCALVEVIATPSATDQDNGLVGWVALTDTTFADYYDPDTETIHD